MNIWILFCTTIAVLLLFPYLRWVGKRLALVLHLRRTCKKTGTRLYGARPFWFFGGKAATPCDFYLETPQTVLAVKLFGLPNRFSEPVFLEDGRYFLRKGNPWTRREVFTAQNAANRPTKPLPAYSFRPLPHLRDAVDRKSLHRILLLHPAGHLPQYQPAIGVERTLYPGDRLAGMELSTLTHLQYRLEDVL